jgi:Protein of unknown function (DUF3761)/Protein of unknown function (DUF732)
MLPVLIASVAATAIAAASLGDASPAADDLVTAPAPCSEIGNRTTDCVERVDANPGGAVALCADGLYSHSQAPGGPCSYDGGVARWLTAEAAPSPQRSHFSAADYEYFRYLQGEGLMPANPSNDLLASTVKLGHAICWALENGNTGSQFVDQTTAADKRLSEHEVRSELIGAVKSYCPGNEALASQ